VSVANQERTGADFAAPDNLVTDNVAAARLGRRPAVMIPDAGDDSNLCSGQAVAATLRTA
ncbi:MAG: hypothetical protein DWQ35_07090, partial [Planctomycetota bacterium]